MEALDRESFDFRADFFGRTIEQELVGSLDGPRRDEARARLEEIARRRAVRVDELIESERSRWSLFRRSVPPSPLASTPPARVFHVDECPVCTGTQRFGALHCGHVICRECYDELRRRTSGDGCACPLCRVVSGRLFSTSDGGDVR